MPIKEPRISLHLDPKLKGLQAVMGKKIFTLIKRRLKSTRGKVFTSEDGGLFFYFTTDRLPWIFILDPSIRGHKVLVSESALQAYEKFKSPDMLPIDAAIVENRLAI